MLALRRAREGSMESSTRRDDTIAPSDAKVRPGGPGTVRGMLSLEQLRQEVATGAIDTIVTAFTDMQGRLIGKRIQGGYFLEEVVEHGIEGCDYLLALVFVFKQNTAYEMANWESGYGDFRIV